MKKAILVLVRPDPKRPDANHPEDVAAAKKAAELPPCWIVLVGSGRERRRKTMSRELDLGDEISKNGVSVFAPAEVSGEQEPDQLARELASYLAEVGLRIPLRQEGSLEVHLPADIDPALLAAVVEAAAVYPGTDVRLGERVLRSSLRWELRRDHFRSPPGKLEIELNGSAPALERVRRQVDRYAGEPFPVLILGETGTGKEVVASMLHERSARTGRFLAQNAAQLPPELADSLLFGHDKGAFTGADVERPGRIREASGGTFFLDEVFNLHPTVQGKLLRALNCVEEGVILVEPVGAGSPRPPTRVHARLVVSALDDPRTEPTVNGGASMRADLYYRVAAGVICLPPLRECLGDLSALCQQHLGRIKRGTVVDDGGIDVLRAHAWPGNVRELRLVLLRALMDSPKGTETLTADMLRDALRTTALPSGARSLPVPCALEKELKRIEVETMRAALRAAGDNAAAAGRSIGMDPKNARNFGARLSTAERKLREMEDSDAG